jgi:hypothetical protein
MAGKKKLYLYLSSGFVLFVFMGSLAFYGPRGTDQFWYMQETETLLQLGTPTSNNYYAGLYWREGFNEQNNYFIHHTLVHYIVYPLASFFGAYAGWMFSSVLSIILGTFLLIRATYNATTSYKVAVFTGMIFLFLPVTIWQSFNILQESIISAYMCLGVWIWERSLNAVQGKVFFNVMGGLFGAVGVFIHPIFTVWCIGWIVKILLERRNIRTWRLWLPLCVTLSSLLAAQYFKILLFPSKFFPTLGALISNKSMNYYLNYTIPPVSFQWIWSKALTALNVQFAITDISVFFFYPFNVLLGLFIAALILRYKRDKLIEWDRFILPVFLLAGFFIIIILHQNHFRYNLIITPIILISTAIVFSECIDAKLCGAKAVFGVMVLFSLFIITDLYLSRYIATDAHAFASSINQRKQGMPDASKGQKILFIFKELDLSSAWALYPRPILFLGVNNLQSSKTIVTVSKFNPRYVMIQKTITDEVEKVLPLTLKKIPFESDRLFEVVQK